MGQFDYRMPPDMRRKSKIKSALMIIIAIVVTLSVIAAGFFIWQNFGKETAVTESPPVEAPILSEAPAQPAQKPGKSAFQYEVGTLQITREREMYADGDMKLVIPKLELSKPVLGLPNPDEAGESEVNTILNKGVGLFFCAQLPGSGNANVSIAGHRDIYGKEFYYLDSLEAGDKLYLEWQGKRYEYEYYDTVIIDPKDPPEVIWAPVMVREFSALTLQTCTPIGIASHRMFVTGRLVNIENLE